MSFLAVNPSGGVPESILGYLEFHSIPDLRILKADLANLWSKHNLPGEFLPGEIRPCDAFRRATATGQQTIKVNWNGGIYQSRMLVREVKCDISEIVRLLVREIVDSRNEVLDYATAGRIVFTRSNNKVSTKFEWGLSPEYNYENILQSIECTYDDFVNFHTRDTVRNLVHKLIRSCNPVNIIPRSQGKFIPRRNHSLLLDLKALLSDLQPFANREECRMDLIPIINSTDQRELVARRASVELTGELDTLVSDLAEHLQKGDDMKIDTVQRITNRALELQERAREYERLLNVRLKVLRSQLSEFIDRVTITEARNAV